MFRSDQRSQSTPDEVFTLGGSGGDLVSIVEGQTTGVLQPGHDYRFSYTAWISTSSSPASRASAQGSWELALSAIPEPAGLMLFVCGLGLLAWRRKRVHPTGN